MNTLFDKLSSIPLVQSLTDSLGRKRPYDKNANIMDQKTRNKVLSTMDLTSLGVGSCGGTGMYVVSGMVARTVAGPGVILSFIIAGCASLLSGFCYAEFGVRVPLTSGSAYTYSYVTVGEFIAFLIGWNMILEYLIGTASGASAISSMIDTLLSHKISKWSIQNLGKLKDLEDTTDAALSNAVGNSNNGVENYPDLLAFFIAAIITVIIMAGVKNSVLFNNVLNALNFFVWIFIVVTGLFFIDPKNWSTKGFAPNGWEGIMQGAATCFYAYIGFDIIATTGEECKKPHVSIPKAIINSLIICLIAYTSVSCILTLDQPFWTINAESPLVELFPSNGLPQARWIVATGAMASLTVSLLGSIFPMPRIIYAMASDGLLFKPLGNLNAITDTPILATLISGGLAAVLALLVSLGDLIQMMSIGTLLAYTLVSFSVLILRYQPDQQELKREQGGDFYNEQVVVASESVNGFGGAKIWI